MLSALREVMQQRAIITMIALGRRPVAGGQCLQASMPGLPTILVPKADLLSALLAANAAGRCSAVCPRRQAVAAARRRRYRLRGLWCVIMTGFAASSSYPLSVVLLFCAGALNLAFYSIAQTIVQLDAGELLAS
jgi:hypothetical protein